jgi:dUTP pyrophosphatase
VNLPIKIKKLSADVVIPTYKHSTDAGFDLAASEDVDIWPGQTVKVPTGLAFDIPEGYEMQIRPRSGLSAKTPIRVILGTIDSGYHGEVSVIAELEPFYYRKGKEISGLHYPNASIRVNKGGRIAQAVIAPVIHAEFQEVDELGDSERGENGFGSTGVTADA